MAAGLKTKLLVGVLLLVNVLVLVNIRRSSPALARGMMCVLMSVHVRSESHDGNPPNLAAPEWLVTMHWRCFCFELLAPRICVYLTPPVVLRGPFYARDCWSYNGSIIVS